MDSLISVKNLSKEYYLKDSVLKAVEDVSIDLKDKEFLIIMGPSSSGKSTLMKMMAGIEPPTGGEVYFKGEKQEEKFSKDVLKKIGFMYQNENLLPWRTVEQNLMLPLEIFKMAGKENQKKNKARIQEVLEMVGLQEYAEVIPGELSGGMKQRVGIARAMVYNPDVVFMDYPFGALDAITKKMLTFDFLNIWKKTQKAFVLSTNSVDEALTCGQRIVFLTEGPARIKEIIDVDIPLEQRDQSIMLLPRYQELRKKVQALIREGYGGKQ